LTELNPSVTQQDLSGMIDEWVSNPQENDKQQRLKIMIDHHTFLETGQKLTTDQNGLILMNQIRKMMSLNLLREDLDQMREQIRKQLVENRFEQLQVT